jgi:hypothetical protein
LLRAAAVRAVAVPALVVSVQEMKTAGAFVARQTVTKGSASVLFGGPGGRK